MNNKIGLNKLANQDQTEVIQPEENEVKTVILCKGDCRYSQNPERQCMFKNIALAATKDGQFACAQYNPMQLEAEEDEGANQANRQLGLAGAKNKQ